MSVKQCVECGAPLSGKKQSYCGPACKARWRYKNTDEGQRRRQTRLAHYHNHKEMFATHKVGQRAMIQMGICICGKPGYDRHHDDYGKPDQVVWYCRSCHVKLTNERRKESR